MVAPSVDVAPLVLAAAVAYGVPVAAVLSESRAAAVVRARRQVVRALVRRGHSVAATARAVARDHSSVLHLLSCDGCGRQRTEREEACAVCGSVLDAPHLPPRTRGMLLREIRP